MNLYTTKDLAELAGVTVRTIQRACAKAGITRRPLMIQGETEKKAVLKEVQGKRGNPKIADQAKAGSEARWGKQDGTE
jgi:hypothetical protein